MGTKKKQEDLPQAVEGQVVQAETALVHRSAVMPGVALEPLTPVMNLQVAKQRLKEFQEFVRGYLKEDEDYGTIPGTKKPTLFKPGADKLCELYGLSDSYEIMSSTVDWDKGLFDYEVRCILTSRRDDKAVSTGLGSCSSFESRYRWRDSTRKCPRCGKETIIKGKAEFAKKDGPGFSEGGWLCFAKKGGCGAKFPDAADEIVGQTIGRVPNPDISDIKNTIIKIAKKRSKVDACLAATRSSGIFTQDLEDLTHAPDDGVQDDLATMREGAKNKGHGNEGFQRPAADERGVAWDELSATKPAAKPAAAAKPSATTTAAATVGDQMCERCDPIQHPRSIHDGETGAGPCLECGCKGFSDVPPPPRLDTVMTNTADEGKPVRRQELPRVVGKVVEFQNTNDRGERLRSGKAFFVKLNLLGLPQDEKSDPNQRFYCYHQTILDALELSLGERVALVYVKKVEEKRPDKVGTVWQMIHDVQQIGAQRFEAGLRGTILPSDPGSQESAFRAEDESQEAT
jgi:hypothetical protein